MSDFTIDSRSKNWTPELDKLLRKWKKQLEKRQVGHINLARSYEKRHYWIGIPATVIATVIATGSFATFGNCDDDDSGKCKADVWIRISTGVIAIIGAGLTGFQTFMNYQSAAEKHKAAAVDYGSMFRALDTMILMPVGIRGEPVATLQLLRTQYDDNVRRSPTLPKQYDAMTYSVIKKNTVEIDLKGCDYDPAEKAFYEANDFDTDDDCDVNIAFELDSRVPVYTATRIEDQVQNSLNRALHFELQRIETHAHTDRQQQLKSLPILN